MGSCHFHSLLVDNGWKRKLLRKIFDNLGHPRRKRKYRWTIYDELDGCWSISSGCYFGSDFVRYQASSSRAHCCSEHESKSRRVVVKFRREIVREFPRPTSDAAFTPNLDSYLPSMISDAKVTDNNLRETQNNEAVWQEVLENTGYDPGHSGPLCTMYEDNPFTGESVFPACAVLYFMHCASHNFPRYKPPAP